MLVPSISMRVAILRGIDMNRRDLKRLAGHLKRRRFYFQVDYVVDGIRKMTRKGGFAPLNKREKEVLRCEILRDGKGFIFA